jgi:hypothetical protein
MQIIFAGSDVYECNKGCNWDFFLGFTIQVDITVQAIQYSRRIAGSDDNSKRYYPMTIVIS